MSESERIYYYDQQPLQTSEPESPLFEVLGPEDWATVESPIPPEGSGIDAVARMMRANVLSRHADSYASYNRPDLDSNVAPDRLLGHPLVTGRVREFFSRNWRSAPIYEHYGADTPMNDDELIDIAATAELFKGTPGIMPDDPMPRHTERFNFDDRELPGLYSRLTLAATDEVHPSIVTESRQILLVAHMLHDDPDGRVERTIRDAPAEMSAFLKTLHEEPPHYLFIEAARPSEG